MRTQSIAISLVYLLLAQPMWGARREQTKLTWNGFQEEVARRNIGKRHVVVFLMDGTKVASTMLRVEEDGIVVVPAPATKRWTSTIAAGTEVKIPRTLIEVVRISGKERGRLYGFLAGLGGASAIAAAVATTSDAEGAAAGAVLILIPIGAAAGYFTGRAFDKSLPDFQIVP